MDPVFIRKEKNLNENNEELSPFTTSMLLNDMFSSGLIYISDLYE